MARKPKKKTSAGSPAWMTTFSDLMTLLLTFFVILFSMSVVSEERFREVASSLRSALIGSSSDSILDSSGETIADFEYDEYGEIVDNDYEGMDPEELAISEDPVTDVNAIPEEVHQLYQTVSEYMTEEGLQADVTISRDQQGVYIEIQEAILFDSGSATLKQNGQETIRSLSGLFTLFENELIIEGYTDDVPMNSAQFPSNWELSVVRAVSVLRYLTENLNLQPSRLSAKGYGEYSPIAPNDSAENRAQNRRVNIVIVHNNREEVNNGSDS